MNPLLVAAVLLPLFIMGNGCRETEKEVDASTKNESVADRPIEDVLRDNTDRLMNIEGVVSVGQALCKETPCIRVGVRALTDSLRRQIPDSLEGHPVDVHELGTVRPLGRP